jgi:signal transduction histidine kinase/ligand-binding sensor domain-containing protein
MNRDIKRKFFITSFFFFLSHFVSAQLIRNAVVINSDQGLSQNSVYAICKDWKGFMWIGTGDGLNRYDGKSFTVFRNNPQTKNSLRGFYINYKMGADNKHCLWFSTERNLVQYDLASQEFTDIIPFSDSVRMQGNKSIVEIDTLQNTIWFIQSAVCLLSYNYIEKVFQRFDFPTGRFDKNPFTSSVGMSDNNGKLWITSKQGLFCFDKQKRSWEQYLSGRNIEEGSFSQNTIWLLNRDSVFSFDPFTKVVRDYKNDVLNKSSYISITGDNKGKVWIGTLNGRLYYAAKNGNEIEFACNINLLTKSQNILEMRCLYFDSSNLLWVGTEGGGVVKLNLNPTNFYCFPSNESAPLTSLYIKGILCEDDGRVWLGTFKKWIYIFDPSTLQYEPLPPPRIIDFEKYVGTVYSIAKDKNGIYWIGYDGILIEYHSKSKKYFFHPVPLRQNDIGCVITHILPQKDFLLLSTNLGLFKVTTSRSHTTFSNILRFAVSESVVCSDNSLWVSTLYSGIKKININQKKVEKSFFTENGFRCIVGDPEHQIIWAASQTGLLAYHVPSGKYQFYGEKNGLLNDYLYGIVRNENEIWVSSNKGIARGILSFVKNEPLPEIVFKCFTKEVGLQSNEFNTGAYGKSKNGILFFGGIQGLNWFFPAKISSNQYEPKVAITGLKVNDKPYLGYPSIEYLKNLKTNYKENTITIKFTGLEFTNPSSIGYYFKLDGVEQDWTIERNSQEVRYANLSPGTYTFRVKAANYDNVLSDEAALSIQILPPFYSRWWFRICMTVIIVLSVFFITKKAFQFKLKNRIRALEKEKALEEERHRISKEMHDDLGAGLTQISLISEAAKRRKKAGRFPSEELGDISNTSRQLIENVSEIIWAMNPDFDTLSGMFAYLREQISKLLEYSGKQFSIKMPNKFEDINIANTRRKNIAMLVKEAVNNAIKHSNSSIINITLELSGQHLLIKISDNGCGFDLTKISKGNGLKNYTYRTGLLNGKVKLHSDERGTDVYFDIPLSV